MPDAKKKGLGFFGDASSSRHTFVFPVAPLAIPLPPVTVLRPHKATPRAHGGRCRTPAHPGRPPAL
eukprot:263421-Chlamydomonas_euryale.AAC.1